MGQPKRRRTAPLKHGQDASMRRIGLIIPGLAVLAAGVAFGPRAQVSPRL